MLKLTLLFLFLGAAAIHSLELSGAGATFPEPLYSTMFYEYKKVSGVSVNYQGIGSGGGIRQLIEKTIDFGGSDVLLNERELKDAGDAVIHIPVCLGAVVLTYNLPGVGSGLKLTPGLIANIYSGKITEWNDPEIARINPGVKLPDLPIVPVVHRSDTSGTTYLFTYYLSQNDSEWNKNIGYHKNIRWPSGIGAKGNSGVARYVQRIPGSIGYVELIYAEQSKMPMVSIKNKKGNFISPSIQSILALPKNKLSLKDLNHTLMDSDQPGFYPVTAFSWIILYREQAYGGRGLDKARELVKLLWWMIHEGQNMNEVKDYGSLPAPVVRDAEDLIKSVVYHGEKVYQ